MLLLGIAGTRSIQEFLHTLVGQLTLLGQAMLPAALAPEVLLTDQNGNGVPDSLEMFLSGVLLLGLVALPIILGIRETRAAERP
jgi:hypothetical protein